MQSQRRSIRYEGRVQGVGFRYTTVGIACRFRVEGFVRNLPDGRVLLVAEGEPAELDRFLAAVEGAMGRYVRNKAVETLPATGEFCGFGIHH
ncbi:MAG: acylphosphatase [Pirellulales bacterium]|nr:acylphosphatase [Pirellulales bacterium]